MSLTYQYSSSLKDEGQKSRDRLMRCVLGTVFAVLLMAGITGSAFAASDSEFFTDGFADQNVLEFARQNIPEGYTDIRSASLPEGGSVFLFARPGAVPEDACFQVRKMDPADGAFAQAQKRVQDAGILYDYFTALDISLTDDAGIEIEPAESVYVFIDGDGIVPSDANIQSMEIQHHKEYPGLDGRGAMDDNGSQVRLETVVDKRTGFSAHDTSRESWSAIFTVDSFSVYTITSAGWADLNIKIECVDENDKGLIEAHKPNDVVYDKGYTSDSMFTVELGSPVNAEDRIRYEYSGKTYYMQNEEYQFQIHGLRRENNKWYYFSEPNGKGKTEFNPQPDFEGENPANTLRSLYRKVMKVPIQYMDDAGNSNHTEIEIPTEDAPHTEEPGIFEYHGTTLDTSDSDLFPKCDKYFFTGKAYIGEPERKSEVIGVVREGGVAHALLAGGEKISLSHDNPLKLLYHQVKNKPDMLKTVSTKEKGMQINLFSYQTGAFGSGDGINNGRKLQFVGDTKRPDPYNKWTGPDGGLYMGIVDEQLKDGYPVMANDKGGESLDYLFDPKKAIAGIEDGTVKHVHTGLDHLFWRDDRGYYHYDSMTNFATIMDASGEGDFPAHRPGHTEGGNFVVYEQPVLPGVKGAGDNPKFLPFNTYESANKPTHKPASDDKNKAYHFGMTIATDFNMPTDGVVPDGRGGLDDMIFEFNGDDDVWVFIDGKLALDLGGIHGRYGGTINFKTGEVVTNAPYSGNSSRYQRNLYGIPEGEVAGMSSADLNKIREDKGFGKLTIHNIKFFYLERGRGASNCEIRFNLVPVEHGLVVGKRTSQKFDDVVDDHMWYQFQAKAVHPDGKEHWLANATYKVIEWNRDAEDPVNGGKALRTEESNSEGRFWLRSGERADFSGAIDLGKAGVHEGEEVKIYVSEVVSSNDPSPTVKAWTGGGNKLGTYLTVPAGPNNEQKRPLVVPCRRQKG